MDRYPGNRFAQIEGAVLIQPPPEYKQIREWVPPMKIPRDRMEAYATYGNPGVLGTLDKEWEQKNMVLARDLPGPVKKLYVHRLVEPFLREALARCESVGVAHYIERMGCFNFRSQRHDSTRPLSYHAFGAAIDINPMNNRAWYRTNYLDERRRRGPIPEPFAGDWWAFWPYGLPEALVLAFESVGFSWGGRWKTFCDPMHVELVG